MNKPIRTMAVLCALLFGALLLNTTYLQYVEAGDLNARDDNQRVRNAEFSRERGAIVVGDQPIADSVRSRDEFKFQRVYPLPYAYAHVSGFYSYLYGRDGVELTENEILSGNDSRLFVDRVVDMVGNAQPAGGSVNLTLDPRAQRAAFDGLRGLGRDVKGAVVAVDPSSGAILANASTPSYDPNLLASHDFGAVTEARERLTSDPDEPLLNRGTQAVLPPGSTFKLVTAAAALESGQYTPESVVPGGFSLDLPQTDRDLPNDSGGDCGGERLTLSQALQVSCNVSFGWLGLRIGEEALREQAQQFGFDETAFDDLPSPAASRFPTGELAPPFLAYSAIGQYDVAATPLQVAMVAAGIANGGTVMRPYLVDEVRAPDLTVLDKTTAEPYRDAVSASTARDLTQMMVQTVRTGTATSAQIPGTAVAGKTGTAQGGSNLYAWFVSFAPADDPEVAVAVLVQDAGVARDAISGGGLAGPIARSVMQAVIR